MNRKFIFVFILLIALFMVDSRPLKRATKFKKCRNGPPQLEVKLSPDPLEPGEDNTFTVSGKLKLPIIKLDNLFIALSDPKSGDLLDSFGVPICETGLKCPVDDGTEFTTKVVYSIPANITEKTFDVLVGITSPPNHIIGCATTSDDS